MVSGVEWSTMSEHLDWDSIFRNTPTKNFDLDAFLTAHTPEMVQMLKDFLVELESLNHKQTRRSRE